MGPSAGNRYIQTAVTNVLRGALGDCDPKSVGHIHAHGLSTVRCDQQEAEAIVDVFGQPETQPPVVAAKSYMGTLGAASGMVELIASLHALRSGQAFPILNYETPDDSCPINATVSDSIAAGDCFLNMNVSPQGQASAVR